jgi:hypothetical protein
MAAVQVGLALAGSVFARAICAHLTVEQEQADVRKMVEKKWKGVLCHRNSSHDWRRF